MQPEQPDQPQPTPQPPYNQQPPQPEWTPPVQPHQSTVPQTPQQPSNPQMTQQPAADPGKTFSIIGLVFAFIFLQIPGLILSIIGLQKSKKAGFSATLAIIGIVLNSLFMLIISALAAITWIAYQGVQERSIDAYRASSAQSIVLEAEMYNAETLTYPTIENLRTGTTQPALSDEESANLKDTSEPIGDEIGYQTCADSKGAITGANVFYYSDIEKQPVHRDTAGTCDSIE